MFEMALGSRPSTTRRPSPCSGCSTWRHLPWGWGKAGLTGLSLVGRWQRVGTLVCSFLRRPSRLRAWQRPPRGVAEPSPRPPWPFLSEPIFGSPQGDSTRPRCAVGAPVLGPADQVSGAAASRFLDCLGSVASF